MRIIKNTLYLCLLTSSLFSITRDQKQFNKKYKQKCLTMELGGRLGNQLFQVATALSLAIDNDAIAFFPDLKYKFSDNLPKNRELFFSDLPTDRYPGPYSCSFGEHVHFHYKPIDFSNNMYIVGYFQSEKYFKHNKDVILEKFRPSKEVCYYLNNKYNYIIDHPKTVAIHLRAYEVENPEHRKCFPFLKYEYYKRASDLFDDDTLFIIFSDQVDWAKKIMKDFNRPHLYIQGEDYHHDFYLMSFCKHQIISPSSFSWWAAYLNENPDKVVVAPDPWFSDISGHDSSNVVPDDWVKLTYEKE